MILGSDDSTVVSGTNWSIKSEGEFSIYKIAKR